jgi:hypothetical protein
MVDRRETIARRDVLKYGLATLACGTGLRGFAMPPATITYDAHSMKWNGRRQLLICGELHYLRSTRAMWPKLLRRTLEHAGRHCLIGPPIRACER